MGYADELGQYLGDFLPCKHDGHPSRFPGLFDGSQRWERLFEDVTVEEEQCLQRHILRGSRDLSRHGQVDQKGTDFWGAQVRRVARVMHEDNALGAGHIRLCRSDTQVFEA